MVSVIHHRYCTLSASYVTRPGRRSAPQAVYGEDEPAVVVRAVRHALGPSPKRRYLAGRVKGWPVGLLCWIFTHMPSWLTDNLM